MRDLKNKNLLRELRHTEEPTLKKRCQRFLNFRKRHLFLLRNPAIPILKRNARFMPKNQKTRTKRP
jgi:hypothetical protein